MVRQNLRLINRNQCATIINPHQPSVLDTLPFMSTPWSSTTTSPSPPVSEYIKPAVVASFGCIGKPLCGTRLLVAREFAEMGETRFFQGDVYQVVAGEGQCRRQLIAVFPNTANASMDRQSATKPQSPTLTPPTSPPGRGS